MLLDSNLQHFLDDAAISLITPEIINYSTPKLNTFKVKKERTNQLDKDHYS